MFYVLAASGRGEALENFLSPLLGGRKSPPLAHLWSPYAGASAYTCTREKKSAYTYYTRPPAARTPTN